MAAPSRFSVSTARPSGVALGLHRLAGDLTKALLDDRGCAGRECHRAGGNEERDKGEREQGKKNDHATPRS